MSCSRRRFLEGALAAAWDDYGRVFGDVEGQPDVVVQLNPLVRSE